LARCIAEGSQRQQQAGGGGVMETSLVPLDTLAGTIKAHIAAGDKAADKAEQHYKSAGLHLLDAKERVKRTANLTWPAFLHGQCGVQRSRADELIAIAEGRTTLAEVRERKADSMRRSRAVVDSPPRGGKSVENVERDQGRDDIASPAVIEDNLLHSIGGMNENARVFKKLLKASSFDDEAVARINTAIEGAMVKWRAVKSSLGVDVLVDGDIEKLKKQLAGAKEKIEEKEGQRKAQEGRANIAAKQVDDATNRAMFAEADKERLQAEVDRLIEENESLRADNLQLDDHAMDIAEKLIEMEDQKKLSKISKLINDHLKHPERTPFQRSAALGRTGIEHADGRRFTKADLAQIHCWRVEGLDASDQRWGNGVRLDTEHEAKLYADYLAREDNMTTHVIRVPGEPALNTVTMNDDGSASIGFVHGTCGSLQWKPLSSVAA
jgi:hypothetical protein